VDGHLGFDALIKFDPFKFSLQVAAHLIFSTPVGDRGVGLKGSLEGPSPWHLKGKVTLHVGPLSPSVPVDLTVGEDKSGSKLPPAKLMPKVESALADERNWSAQMPEEGDSLVSLREIPDEEKRLLAHPLGTVQVRQQVMPFGVEIEKFGSNEPADFTRFDVTKVRVEDASDDGGSDESSDDEPPALREKFGPAQFFEMSEDEKLSRPSFEKYEAGCEVTDNPVHPPKDRMEALSTTQTLAFECSYVDRTRDVYRGSQGDGNVAAGTAAKLAEVSAVAKSDARNTGRKKFANENAGKEVTVDDTSYVVADRKTMERADVAGVPSEGTTYVEAEQAMRKHVESNPDAEGTLVVVASHEVDAAGQEASP